MKKHFWMFLCLTALGSAQGIEGPSLGFEFDSNSQVTRPIRGVVGAALLGDAREIGLQRPAVGASLAVGFDAAQGKAVQQKLADGSRAILADSEIGFDLVLLSPSETFAALRGGTKVSIYRLDNGAKTSEFDVPADATLLALSDDGSILGNANESVWRWSGDGSISVVEGTASAAAFEARSARAAVALGSRLLLLDAELHLAALGELESISGVAFASQGRVIALSAAGRKALIVRENAATMLNLDFEPSLLRALGSDVYQVSDTAGTPVWLLDVNEARVAFVPKATEAVNE